MQNVTVRQSGRHQPGIADYVRQVGHWVGFVRSAMTVARERRMLLELDDRMLKDIGVGRSEAFYEATKPFGDIPFRRTTQF
jgi:uncharacterized protein YjiS (DUF1127 family)